MNMQDEIIISLGIFGAFLLILTISGIISDFIFPNWKWLDNWINTLPMMTDEENSY